MKEVFEKRKYYNWEYHLLRMRLSLKWEYHLLRRKDYTLKKVLRFKVINVY